MPATTKTKCLTGCGLTSASRGLCSRCRAVYEYLILTSQLTEDDAIRDGKIEPLRINSYYHHQLDIARKFFLRPNKTRPTCHYCDRPAGFDVLYPNPEPGPRINEYVCSDHLADLDIKYGEDNVEIITEYKP